MSKEKKFSGIKILLISIGSAVLLGIVLALVLIGIRNYKSRAAEKDITVENTEFSDSIPKTEGETVNMVQEVEKISKNVSTSDVSAIVDSVMPSIVSIECTYVYESYSFFGGSQKYEGKSSGTGFIIGQKGDEILLVTNNHVVDGTDSVTVTFFDDKSAEARIKGTDSYYDLAIISVDAGKLDSDTLKKIRIAVIGDSDNMLVGSMAVAIGNSMGYGQSTTVGYIGGLNRKVTVDGIDRILLQTDAAINPGNSGGPLLNIYGEVIGINSVKFASAEVEGMGYAIPMSVAIPIINELMNRDKSSGKNAGYLGINGKEVNETFAESFAMPVGVYISEVAQDSPAQKAGLHVGDIITTLNGRKVRSIDEINSILDYITAGNEIVLEVSTLKDGKYEERTISVVLGKRKG